MDSVKPFLRWAGSKRKQLSTLRTFWNGEYERYIEPFAGSACFFFDVQPANAILSDLNEELIETFEVVCARPAAVYDSVASIPRTKDNYYAIRAQPPTSLSKIERAARFIFLNRNCFNGIYRTNSQGAFNVPFASSRAGQFVTREEFLYAAKMLKRAQLRTCDFGNTLRYTKAGDFVYLDPPYVVAARRVFREYGARHFDWQDIERLAGHLDRMNNRGVAFLVSYADCRESRWLATHWSSHRIRVRRHVAGFHGARKAGFERLITNISRALK
jgi:DNA adenine methylase